MRSHVLLPLREPPIRRLVLGGAISAYGDALQNAAQAWIAVQLTHSARGVGLFAMFWLLPRALSSLVAGVVVDRHRRSSVLLGAVVAGTLVSVLFLVGVATHALTFRRLLVLAACFGVISPFEINARNALLPSLGTRTQTPAIVAVSFFVMYLADLLGLVTGGAMLGTVGAIGCVVVNLGSYVAYLTLVATLRSPAVTRRTADFLGTFLDGVRFVQRRGKAALPLLVGAIFAILGFHFDRSTLPLFAVETLHVSPHTYGLLLAAPSMGAVLLLGASRPRGVESIPLRVVASALVLAISLAGLSLVPNARAAFLLLFAAGAARGVHYNAIATLLQLKVPDALRGRIFSFYNVAGGLYGLGGLIMGGLAPTLGVYISGHAGALRGLDDVHGLRGVLVVAAVATFLATLAVMRPLRRLGDQGSELYTEDRLAVLDEPTPRRRTADREQ